MKFSQVLSFNKLIKLYKIILKGRRKLIDFWCVKRLQCLLFKLNIFGTMNKFSFFLNNLITRLIGKEILHPN